MRLARGNRRSGCQSGAADLLAQEQGPASPIAATILLHQDKNQDGNQTRKSPGPCRGSCL